MSHWTDAMDQARQSGRAEVGKIAADLAVMVARGEDEVVRLRRENARLRSRLARVAHWKELFSGGNYLAGADFKGKTFTAKIAKVESTSMEDDSGRTKSLPIVTWDIKAKPWLMCKTTCYCLAAMYGTDPAMWVGKRVTLYATMVQVGKGEELGVRVKGSPDLPTPIEVEIKLPRKRPFKVKLVNTNTRGPAANGNGKPTAPPAEPPPPAAQDQAASLADAAEELQGEIDPQP